MIEKPEEKDNSVQPENEHNWVYKNDSISTCKNCGCFKLTSRKSIYYYYPGKARSKDKPECK